MEIVKEVPHLIKVVAADKTIGFVGRMMTFSSKKKRARVFEGNMIANLKEVRTSLSSKSNVINKTWKTITATGPIKFVPTLS